MDSLAPTVSSAAPPRDLAHTVRPLAQLVAAHPLGPIVFRVPAENKTQARIVAFIVLTACVAVFAVAAHLTPDPAGFGTHRQLGYAACLMPVLTGCPCPTCGMTTAFAYAVRGQLGPAFDAQPAGFLIALVVALTGVAAATVLGTGTTWRFNWYRIPPARLAIGILVIVLAGWLYKIVTFSSFHVASGG